jgi:hypothetical protein
MTKREHGMERALMVAVLLAGAFAVGTPARAGQFLATGQTTSYQADKNDGVAGPVDAPDDGALLRGAALRYLDKSDTIVDLNTRLEWEKKCLSCGGLHQLSSLYVWSADGSQETIWDWIEDINAENGGKGFAGHSDWRVPNVRELQSIVDYGRFDPTSDPVFDLRVVDDQ